LSLAAVSRPPEHRDGPPLLHSGSTRCAPVLRETRRLVAAVARHRVLASNHKDWRTLHESLEHADCRPVADWATTNRPIETSSTQTGCAGELSYRPAACHHGSAQRTSIESSRGRVPERHRRLKGRHAPSMPGFCSHTAYIFRRSKVIPDSDAIGSALCVDHAATRPPCRRVCALTHVASVASLASSANPTTGRLPRADGLRGRTPQKRRGAPSSSPLSPSLTDHLLSTPTTVRASHTSSRRLHRLVRTHRPP